MLLSAPDASELQHSVPVLADFPCALVPAEASQGARAFPALGWQMQQTRAVLQQLVLMPHWLQVSRVFATCCG